MVFQAPTFWFRLSPPRTFPLSLFEKYAGVTVPSSGTTLKSSLNTLLSKLIATSCSVTSGVLGLPTIVVNIARRASNFAHITAVVNGNHQLCFIVHSVSNSKKSCKSACAVFGNLSTSQGLSRCVLSCHSIQERCHDCLHVVIVNCSSCHIVSGIRLCFRLFACNCCKVTSHLTLLCRQWHFRLFMQFLPLNPCPKVVYPSRCSWSLTWAQ